MTTQRSAPVSASLDSGGTSSCNISYLPWKSSRPNKVAGLERMIHVVKDSTKLPAGAKFGPNLDLLGLTYNISWHSHHQSRVLEELHCNASDAKPGVASFGNWCGLAVPQGTRQYKAQGLVHEVPAPKNRNIRKKRFGFGVVYPSNLLICLNCLLLCGVLSSCAIYLVQ